MEAFKKEEVFCRLCQNTINDENYLEIEDTIRDALNVLLLKLTLEEETKHLICRNCCNKLIAAYKFKCTCINNERRLSVGLKDFYQIGKQSPPSKNILDDNKMCRLCFKLAREEHTSLLEVDTDIISIYIPEVNLNISEDPYPTICKSCWNSINTHGVFIKTCLEFEEKATKIKIEHPQLDIPLKNEDDIKSENIEPIEVERESNIFLENYSSPQEPPGTRCHKCMLCDYRTYSLGILRNHMNKHKKEGLYCCDSCTFTTSRSCQFKRHMITHKNPSKIEWYKCDKCDFKSKYKYNLTRHHSETKGYQCDRVSTKTSKNAQVGLNIFIFTEGNPC